jgi:tetratricopeptide (TPR) repeat protein
MKKYIIALISLVLVSLGSERTYAQQDLLNAASVAYDSAQYQQAIDAYEQIATQFGVNPELYYNLGNAYYKQKNYPKAILNYERCLLYDPSNVDAQENVELARLQCVDKIEAIEPMFFVNWSNAIRDSFSCDTWGTMAIILFLLFIAGCGMYFFSHRTARRKLGFYGGILAILLCFVCIHYANAQRDHIQKRDYAIVMTPSVIVRSSPADSGTQLFTIHEGLKVHIRSTLSGWSEIELTDGQVGWMPSEGLEVI